MSKISSSQAENYFAGSGFAQAGIFCAANSGIAFVPVRGIQNLVGDAQPLDRMTVDNVRFDNFLHVLRPNSTVKNAVGINSHGRSKFTLIQASGLVRAHQFQSALRQLGLE